MLDPVDGSEIDWIVGYGPPPEKFREKVDQALKGIDTYKSLSAWYAKDPRNVEAVYKLAKKVGQKSGDERTPKLYREVLALDPEGMKGMAFRGKDKVSFTEDADFSLAELAMRGRNPDLGPFKAFIRKYADSKLLKTAYSYMSSYYSYQAPKDEAVAFFDEYLAKYPQDKDALASYVFWAVRTKTNTDEGIKLAEKIKDLEGYDLQAGSMFNLAQLYAQKGDKTKAGEVYGEDFMEGMVTDLAFDLIRYANFWVSNNDNLKSAEKMADTALKLEPENQSIIQQAAGVYLKLDKTAKALAVFGPNYIRMHMGNASVMNSYAWFWQGQVKNLDSALGAAKKSVALSPRAAAYDTLSAVYIKLKNLPEALKAAEKAVELAGQQAETYKKKLENLKKLMAKKEGE